jgi:hypothetical protein
MRTFSSSAICAASASTLTSKAKIVARGITFPVLVHEIIKGVMELLSAHGLPKDKKLAEYVINKADFLSEELI